MPSLLGTAPNQVSVNSDLGKLAFMDVVDTVTNNPYLDTAISDIKPSLLLDFANSKTLDPRITYTRASTASYYDGKTTAVAEQNLLNYSQEFDNAAWGKTNVTATANSTTAPDSTLTADKIMQTTSAGDHRAYGVVTLASSTIYTFSVYAKAAELSWIALNISDSVNDYTFYDLSTGTLGTVDPQTTATITSVGNGWYRCTYTKTSTGGSSRCDICVTTGNNVISYTGADNTSGVYIWGAQLEQRSAVSSYTPTTSAAITNYIPALQTAAAGVPRFDHDPVTGESKGFLIEEQRSNLVTYSEQFDNAAWTKQEITIQSNLGTAPDGTQTADLAIPTTVTGTHQISKTGVVASSTCACSIYVKAYGYSTFDLLDGTSGVNGARFDIAAGTVTAMGSGTGTITPIGNGWYRCTAIMTTTGYRLYIPTSAIGTTGNGYSGLYIWGAQLEAGSFATSYIPTTSAQVTRSADAASMTGSNFSGFYNVSEGTFYSEVVFSNTAFKIVAEGASSSDFKDFSLCVDIQRVNFSNRTVAGNYDVYGTTGSIPLNTVAKISGSYSGSSADAVYNGALSTLKNAVTQRLGADRMYIGSRYNATNCLNGTIKKLAYYPKRLSDAELQEMTQ